MEDLHATHKPVVFGWVLMLQELIARRRARTAWREPAANTPPADLHNLAAPH